MTTPTDSTEENMDTSRATLSLTDYCAQVQIAGDLATTPLFPIGTRPKSKWHWDNVATAEVDRALERWFWGLALYGRPVAIRAAAQMVASLFPVWDAGVTKGGAGMKAMLEALESDTHPSPGRVYEMIRAWCGAPSQQGADELERIAGGNLLTLLDQIGSKGFRRHWQEDPWMFVVTAAYAAATTVYARQKTLPMGLGIVAVSGRIALAPTLGSGAAMAVWCAATAGLENNAPEAPTKESGTASSFGDGYM